MALPAVTRSASRLESIPRPNLDVEDSQDIEMQDAVEVPEATEVPEEGPYRPLSIINVEPIATIVDK